jgi:NADH-quinone oxidoreductase subunit C
VNAAELAGRVRERFPDIVVARDEATAVVSPDALLGALGWLRDQDDLAFDFLSDLTATDWADRDPRFWVAYHLSSTRHRHRLRVKVGLSEAGPSVPSVVSVYPTADWLEREVWDFFGIVFDGHPDLRRIIMPDDWDGHPLRKDYTLGGVGTQYRGAFIPPVEQRSP